MGLASGEPATLVTLGSYMGHTWNMNLCDDTYISSTFLLYVFLIICGWAGEGLRPLLGCKYSYFQQHSDLFSLIQWSLLVFSRCGFGLTSESHYVKRNSSSLWPQLLVCTEQCQIYSGSFPNSFHSWALKTCSSTAAFIASFKVCYLKSKRLPASSLPFLFSVLKILSLKKRTWNGAPDSFLLE